MKTIYLKEKRSGNYEVSNRSNATHTFSNKKEFIGWYDGEAKEFGKVKTCTNKAPRKSYSGQIIKATYSRSQLYYFGSNEFLTAFCK